MGYKIPYGKKEIFFETPKEFNVNVVTPLKKPAVKNFETAIRDSLLHPINSSPLSELIKGKKSACIVVTDITRPCPDKELLPPILEILEKEIDRKNITILIAAGMHREMTYDEKVEKYGKKIVEKYNILYHDGKDEKNLISLGTTKNGTPILISKISYESEFLLSLGVVEPHQFAGYSGGYKTLAIGAAGDNTISYTHSPKMLENPNTRIGNFDENPIQEDIIEIGTKAGLDFIVNVVLGLEKNVMEIAAGSPLETHKSLIKKAKEIYEVSIEKPYDVVVCGLGFPKDANLYQASRAASYLLYLPKPVVKKDGYIIILAKCQEGAGKGLGEKRFLSLLGNSTLEEILEIKDKFKAGEQRAFLMAKVLKYCKVIIVGSETPEIVKETKMINAKKIDDAFQIIKNDLGNEIEMLILPNSLITLPIID